MTIIHIHALALHLVSSGEMHHLKLLISQTTRVLRIVEHLSARLLANLQERWDRAVKSVGQGRAIGYALHDSGLGRCETPYLCADLGREILEEVECAWLHFFGEVQFR